MLQPHKQDTVEVRNKDTELITPVERLMISLSEFAYLDAH